MADIKKIFESALKDYPYNYNQCLGAKAAHNLDVINLGIALAKYIRDIDDIKDAETLHRICKENNLDLSILTMEDLPLLLSEIKQRILQ